MFIKIKESLPGTFYSNEEGLQYTHTHTGGGGGGGGGVKGVYVGVVESDSLTKVELIGHQTLVVSVLS